MRGLPPQPLDVCKLVQDIDVNGHTVSVGFWLRHPSFATVIPSDLNALAAAWFLTCMPEFTAIMHSGASFTACRMLAAGLSVTRDAPPNHGLWTGGQADNVATGIRWITGQRGRRGWAMTYVPAVPDRFISDNWRLNQTAWGNLLDSSSHLLAELNSLPAPDGGFVQPGTLHVSVAGAPLNIAQFAPFIGSVPISKVVTIRRRIPARGGLSPSP